MEEATAAPARARFSPVQLGIVVLAVAFCVLAALVAAGRLDSLDHYAVVHWMPALDPARAGDRIPAVTGVFLPFELEPSPWWHRLLDTVMYPASVLVSFTVFAIGAVVLWRRGAKIAAVAWGSLWFVANALEVTAKIAIEKPALYVTEDGTPYHLAAFDHSYPSGHAMRAVLVAGLLLVRLAAARLGGGGVGGDRAGLPRRGVVARALGRGRRRPLRLPRGARHLGRRRRARRAARVVEPDPADVAALLARLEAGELGDPLPVLAYVAGQQVELPEAELAQARRRALLVLASGGDPHRELDVDAPAVKSLAADLYDETRRAQLAQAIDGLVLAARELPNVRAGGALPRRRRRPRLAPLRARARRGGARRRGCSVRGIATPPPAADPCLKSGTSIE